MIPVPKRFRDLRFSQLDETSKIVVAAERWVTGYVIGDLPVGRGLALIGPPGRGKTAVACAAINELRWRLREELAAKLVDLAVGYTTFEGYLKRERRIMQLEALLRKTDDIDDVNDLRELTALQMQMRNDVDVLLIDDVGKEHTTATGYAEDEFDHLLRHRYDLGLTTLLTSNVAIKNWGQRYSAAMESFVHEAFEIVKADGVDYRK